jgi:hypothetical protein
MLRLVDIRELVTMGLVRSLFTFLRRPRLTIELVPRPCWFKNVRAVVSPDQWDTIRRSVFAGAANKCQICGWRASAHRPLHCHEVWRYHGWTGVQKLEGFLALCNYQAHGFGRNQRAR